jgi:hypothetical protein
MLSFNGAKFSKLLDSDPHVESGSTSRSFIKYRYDPMSSSQLQIRNFLFVICVKFLKMDRQLQHEYKMIRCLLFTVCYTVLLTCYSLTMNDEFLKPMRLKFYVSVCNMHYSLRTNSCYNKTVGHSQLLVFFRGFYRKLYQYSTSKFTRF